MEINIILGFYKYKKGDSIVKLYKTKGLNSLDG